MAGGSEVTLREYLESQISWVDRHFASQITTIQEKTKEAKDQIDERLKSMNEFRDALRDQASRLMTRVESNAQHDALEARMKSLELNRAAGEGKTLMISAFVAFVASILVVVIAQWIIK